MSAEPQIAHPMMPHAAELHRQGQIDEAAAIYLKILAESPRDFDAVHLLGVIAMQQGRFEAAQGLINNALALSPNNVAAIGNLGNAYMRDGQLDAALKWFEIALKLQPDSVAALTNAGTALHHMGRTVEAIPLLRKAYASGDRSYAVCNCLGSCLIKSGDAREAAAMFEQATLADPGSAEGWANLSVALNATGEHEQALMCADKAVRLKPESSTALGALGAAQLEQGKLSDAIESYRQGVALPGPSTQMLLAFANALLTSGFNDEAIAQLEQVIQIAPDSLNARWVMAMARLKAIYDSESDLANSRQAFSEAIDQVAAWYRDSVGIYQPSDAVGISQPFYLAYQPFNNRELLRRYGRLCVAWMKTLPSEAQPLDDLNQIPIGPVGGRKLRVGIASSHIHEHSVWNAITKGWVDHLDASKFDVFLFQLSPTSDQETERARRTAAHFEDRPTHLGGWIEAIRASALDVIIYPEIGMDPLTVKLASLRLAPVQAVSWGHPETSGLPTLDLYLSAAALEPAHAQDNYTEKLVMLPNLGVYVEPLAPVPVKISLKSLNLPRTEPLLLCPGSPFKYTPLYDDVWVEIARSLRKKLFKRSSGGRLVFFRSRSDSIDRLLETRLRAAFDRGGVDFDGHVSIISNLERAKYFELMRKSALLLDTLGFSGFNTAFQAIECDLPVLAFEGDFMRGRLASAILRQLDLPELIATTKQEFIGKAIELAGDPGARRKIRSKIIERRHVLFRDLAPVRALERELKDAAARAGDSRT